MQGISRILNSSNQAAGKNTPPELAEIARF